MFSKQLRRIALGMGAALALSLAAASAASAATNSLLDNVGYYTVNNGSSFCRYVSPTSVPAGGGTASQARNSDGTVSLSISGAGGYADDGFYEQVGKLGDLTGYTVKATGDSFGTNLWFDTNTGNDSLFNGTLFSWTQSTCAGGGDTYSAGGDTYSLGPSSMPGGGGQSLTVDSSSSFALTCNGSYQSVTLTQLQAGYCSGIDSNTPVAVWVGITAGSGQSLTTTITSAQIQAGCLTTGLARDGFALTASVANPSDSVSGRVDATGCNIGVYYGPLSNGGMVSGADVSGANYYGIVDNASTAAVSITDSSIHNIGENPFNGTQHGVGVFYTTLGGDSSGNDDVSTGPSATGTLSGSTIASYQKNGVVVNGPGASATVQGNTVTGNGMINYIAQNGVEIARGASAVVKANSVSGNWYTPATVTACGLLFYQAGGVKQQANTLFANQTNICNAGRGGGNTDG